LTSRRTALTRLLPTLTGGSTWRALTLAGGRAALA